MCRLAAETEAPDMLVWTPPATVAGILALLGPALRQARIDDDRTDAIKPATANTKSARKDLSILANA